MRAERAEEFERSYGPHGEWVELFRRADGFAGTDLWCDPADRTHFITIDRWDSRDAFDAFQLAFAREYRAIDARTENFTLSEERIGKFESD